MAEVFYFHVQEDRSIKYKLLEPIMQEDKDVATWRFRIPKVLNEIDMSAWSWWFVYVNAKGQTFSELLTLTDDIDEPDSYSTADYDIDYGISKFPGSFSFALEAISAEQGGEISGEWHTKTYKHKVDGTLQGNQAEYAETESDIISALLISVQNKYAQLVGGATPLPVNLKSQMTDHDKVYLYTGSESGESTGYWYHWNGTDFVPGGQYASGIVIDPTLTQSGQAADAKATGDAVRGQVSQLSESIAEIEDDVNNVIHAFPNRFKELIPVETDISSTIGNCSGTGVIDTTNGARQHTDYLLISDYEKFGLAEDFKTSRLYWVRCFSDIGVFVGSANASAPVNTDTKSETILNAFPTAKYVVLAIKKSNDGSMVDADGGVVAYKYVKKMSGNVSLDDVYESKFKRDYYSEDISLQYNIDADGHYTKGWLKLPPNYKSSGRPVPLIVFVHGSSDFGNIDAPITNLYQDYYNFLKNCGYAVFDCYAWGNKYNASTGGFTQTWGTPINRKCYVSGINYIIENFNVSKDNIFVASKSLGGVQSLSMLYDETINIRAVGMLAPLLNPFEVYLGYDKTTRQTVTREFGFSADTGNVLDFDSVPSDAYWEYITENMDKWVGNVTYFNGLPIKNADKPNYYNNKAGFLDLIRSGLNRPLKIWIAKDDSALITSAKAMVQSLNNGGCRAEIHELPENTGAHHAVDNSPLALQKTNVTTRCGVHYDSVPLAYYELAEWFDKWCTE